MPDLYTTAEVQKLLKVDRVTVYRMLQDGRLRGVKIGHQWRFEKTVVDRLLSHTADPVPSAEIAGVEDLPVDCLQTIQNLVADISGLDAIMTDPDGRLLTEPRIQSALNREIISKPGGFESNKFYWQAFAQQALHGKHEFTTPNGIGYAATVIHDHDKPAAVFICGGFLDARRLQNGLQEQHRDLARTWNIPLELVERYYGELPVYDTSGMQKLARWLKSVLHAMQSILNERSNFIGRMNQIANLTRL